VEAGVEEKYAGLGRGAGKIVNSTITSLFLKRGST